MRDLKWKENLICTFLKRIRFQFTTLWFEAIKEKFQRLNIRTKEAPINDLIT